MNNGSKFEKSDLYAKTNYYIGSSMPGCRGEFKNKILKQHETSNTSLLTPFLYAHTACDILAFKILHDENYFSFSLN